MQGERWEQDQRIITDVLRDYWKSRLDFYRKTRLKNLLAKDVLMWSLRGILTAPDFVENAFAAYESSSEEGVMGKSWQRLIKELSQPAVIDAGDVLAERDGALWVVEVKSQTNTLNSASEAQTVRTLKERVAYHGTFHQARRQPVKAMIGVLRGKEDDREKVFASTGPRTENRDLDGFPYRLVVGRAFWRWLTGRPSIFNLIQDYDEGAAELAAARARTLDALQEEMAFLLASKDLPPTIGSVLALTFEDEPN